MASQLVGFLCFPNVLCLHVPGYLQPFLEDFQLGDKLLAGCYPLHSKPLTVLSCSTVVGHAQKIKCLGPSSSPGETDTSLPLTVMPVVDFHFFNNVILTIASLAGLIPFKLSAYGLPARCPTLKDLCYHIASQRLPTRWSACLPGRASHPLDYTTLPGRTKDTTSRPTI